jgi:transcriptional regulator with XRE-family HTH domain
MTAQPSTPPAGVVPAIELQDRLRIARRHAGLDQRTLARKIGASANTYSSWESGQARPRDLVKMAKAIADVTGVSTEWILGLGPTSVYSWNLTPEMRSLGVSGRSPDDALLGVFQGLAA